MPIDPHRHFQYILKMRFDWHEAKNSMNQKKHESALKRPLRRLTTFSS